MTITGMGVQTISMKKLWMMVMIHEHLKRDSKANNISVNVYGCTHYKCEEVMDNGDDSRTFEEIQKQIISVLTCMCVQTIRAKK